MKVTIVDAPPPLTFPCWMKNSAGDIAYAHTKSTGVLFTINCQTGFYKDECSSEWVKSGFAPVVGNFTLNIEQP